jgi:uncharacterized protein (TIGR03067 family)
MNCLCTLVLAGCLTVPIDVPVNDPAPQQDIQRFQGSWKPMSIQNPDGRFATAEELRQTRLEVNGNKFKLETKEATITGTFNIDVTRSPKTIDVVLDAKDGERPTKLLGIYRIDGDRRRSFFAMPDQPRPKSFAATTDKFLRLEWERANSK